MTTIDDDVAAADALTRIIGLNASWPTLVQHYLRMGYTYPQALAAAGVPLP